MSWREIALCVLGVVVFYTALLAAFDWAAGYPLGYSFCSR
jgi:hypothetical protein